MEILGCCFVEESEGGKVYYGVGWIFWGRQRWRRKQTVLQRREGFVAAVLEMCAVCFLGKQGFKVEGPKRYRFQLVGPPSRYYLSIWPNSGLTCLPEHKKHSGLSHPASNMLIFESPRHDMTVVCHDNSLEIWLLELGRYQCFCLPWM